MTFLFNIVAICSDLMMVVLALGDGTIQLVDTDTGSVKKVFKSDIKPEDSVTISTSSTNAIVSFITEPTAYEEMPKLTHIMIDLAKLDFVKIETYLPDLFTLKSTSSPDSVFTVVESVNNDRRKLVHVVNMIRREILSKSAD